MEVVFVEDDTDISICPPSLLGLLMSMELTKNMSKLVSLVCNFNSNGCEP